MSRPQFKPKDGDLRGAARIYMQDAFSLGDVLLSNDPVWAKRQKFTTLTGHSQAGLEALWAGPKKGYTTCGDFAGHFTDSLGLGWLPLLSLDDPRAYYTGIGKRMAWVPIDRRTRPGFGDVFKQVKKYQHVGVSLDCDPSAWRTAEGGQGSPPDKWDAVKRKSTEQLTAVNGILGWIDIVVHHEFTEPNTAVPKWLIGVWEVSWPNQTYWYYFSPDRHVYFTSMKTMLDSFPWVSQGMGMYGINATKLLTRWDGTGTMERFAVPSGKPTVLTGKVDGLPNPITATRKVDLGSAFAPFQP
jgi:hypothetical protein